MPDPMQPAALVREINAVHGTSFDVAGRYVAGLQGGAWKLHDPYGRLAVLKCGGPYDVTALAGAVDQVRAAGYPMPRWYASGRSSAGLPYYVTEHVPGRSATPLTAANTPALIAVLERQAGLKPVGGKEWADEIRSMVYGDDARSIVLARGEAGESLVRRFDRLLADQAPVGLPVGDLVHGDFNSCNILLDRGAVSGVIDVDAMGAGTRVFDYACLLREAYLEDYGRDVIEPLRRAVAPIATAGVLALCAAAAAYFIVGFKLRHEPNRLPQVLARLHHFADDLPIRAAG